MDFSKRAAAALLCALLLAGLAGCAAGQGAAAGEPTATEGPTAGDTLLVDGAED